MKLWLLTQGENRGYDTFDSAVVAAMDEAGAKSTTFGGYWFGDKFSPWASNPDKVSAKLLCDGYDGEPGVILESFNAG